MALKPHNLTHQEATAAAYGGLLGLQYSDRSNSPPANALYDFVLDSVGGMKPSPLKQAVKKALKPGGSYVSIDDGKMLLESARMDQIRELVENGAIKPVLGHAFSLEEIAQAHRLAESGHKRGGEAVTIAE